MSPSSIHRRRSKRLFPWRAVQNYINKNDAFNLIDRLYYISEERQPRYYCFLSASFHRSSAYFGKNFAVIGERIVNHGANLFPRRSILWREYGIPVREHTETRLNPARWCSHHPGPGVFSLYFFRLSCLFDYVLLSGPPDPFDSTWHKLSLTFRCR